MRRKAIFAILNAAILLLSSCGYWIPQQSKEQSGRIKIIESLYGSQKTTVISKFGYPLRQIFHEETSYLLYARTDDAHGVIVSGMIVPIPEDRSVASCYLLEFDENDLLVDHEVYTNSLYSTENSTDICLGFGKARNKRLNSSDD